MRDVLAWLPSVVAIVTVAAAWGSLRTMVQQLREAVDLLARKVELLAALERADALHAQEMVHLRERLTTAEAELHRQRERTHDLANALSEARAEWGASSHPPRPSGR